MLLLPLLRFDDIPEMLVTLMSDKIIGCIGGPASQAYEPTISAVTTCNCCECSESSTSAANASLTYRVPRHREPAVAWCTRNPYLLLKMYQLPEATTKSDAAGLLEMIESGPQSNIMTLEP